MRALFIMMMKLVLLVFVLCGAQSLGGKPLEQTLLDSSEEESSPSLTKPISVLLVNGPYLGHFFPLLALGEELMKRGHNVTLCACVPRGSKTFQEVASKVGINFVDAGFSMTEKSFKDFHVLMESGGSIGVILGNMSEIINSGSIKTLEKIEELGMNQFDIIVCDVGLFTVGAFVHLLGKKAVIFNSLLNFEFNIVDWPTPFTASGQSDDLTFFERLMNVVLLHPLVSCMLYYIQFKNVGRFEEVMGNEDSLSYPGTRIPMIKNSAFGFEFPKSRLPLVEYVGPFFLTSPPLLDQTVKDWLDTKPERTVIYISMGTTATISIINARAILHGIMLKTRYSIVWVLKKSNRGVLEELNVDATDYRDRLYLEEWVSQQAIMAHKAIVMCILHCGLNGVQESIFHSLPVICFPSLFDQFEVATRIDSAGVGIAMYGAMEAMKHGKETTAEKITDAVDKIAAGNYTKNIRRLQRIHRLMGGVTRAADLVEFYEDVGYSHLVPAYIKYNWSWVELNNVDVWLVWGTSSCFTLWLCYRFIRYILKCVKIPI